MEFTEKQISAVARVLSDRSAYDCGVHKDDNWQVYGEDYLESAKAALAVLSAAAPQVVADERKGSPYPDYDRGFSNGWDACAKRAAAPVQAQEQWIDKLTYDAQVDEWAIEKGNLELEIEALKSRTPVQAQEPIGYAPTYLTERMAAGDSAVMLTVTRKPLPGHGVTVALYTAPVQPVAVPDGWKLDLRATHYTLFKGNTVVANLAGPDSKENAAVIARMLAAPSAQGDKK